MKCLTYAIPILPGLFIENFKIAPKSRWKIAWTTIKNSQSEFISYQKAFSYTNFKEFLVVFNSFQLPENWFKIGGPCIV